MGKTNQRFVNDGGPAFPQPYPPQAFQRAMVFVDGSNLLYRLESQRLVVSCFMDLFKAVVHPYQLQRAYFYSSAPLVAKAKEVHGVESLDGCRIVLGDAVSTGDGNYREKGVDALLVADLVYHAAAKNFDIGFVFTHDSDFHYPLRRVEDFGCKTYAVALCIDLPERLRNSADGHIFISTTQLIEYGLAKQS